MYQNSDLQITVFNSFEEAELFWTEFEQHADCLAFQSFHWLQPWFEKIGYKQVQSVLIIKVAFADEQPLMLLPLCIKKTSRISVLTWLGGTITDYHAPLLNKNFSEKIDQKGFLSIWNNITHSITGYDAIDLCKQPEYIGNQANPFIYLTKQKHPSSAYITSLNGSPAEFIRVKRSNRWIQNENRKRRNLERMGDVRFFKVTTVEDLNKYLPVMMSQKSKSYQDLGAKNFFSQKEYRDFIYSISKRHLNDGFVQFFVLTINNIAIATHWGLLYKKRCYSLMPTYEKGEYSRYSPGTILFRYIFDWCFEHQVETFDFTIGDEFYKKLWSDTELQIYDHAIPITNRGAIYTFANSFMRYTKRKIKNSPRAYNFFTYIRRKTRHAL